MMKGRIVRHITESGNHAGHLIYRAEKTTHAEAAKFTQNIPNAAVLKKE